MHKIIFRIGFGVSEATGPPVEGAAESRRKLNESTETSDGSGSEPARRLRLRKCEREF